jgi:integrase
MRLGEITWLKRRDIDRDKCQITLEKTKNDDARVVPLAGEALRLLKARLAKPGRPEDLIFPGRNPERPSEISGAWVKAKKRAGITNFRFHDLRHSAAAFLVDAGATDLQIAAVLGHRTLQMVKRYAHVRKAIAAKVVADMNERIFSNLQE